MIDRLSNLSSVGQELLDIGRDHGVDILLLIEAGWIRSVGAGDARPEMLEREMTRSLQKGMSAAVNSGAVDSAKEISVFLGTEIWGHSQSGYAAGLTDISIHFRDIRERIGDIGEPHAIIECKRVEGGNTDLCRAYVVDGIDDRFISQKYAATHSLAFMVGYLLSPDIASAVFGINKYLSGKGRNQDHLKPCAILKKNWARSSRHARSNPATPIDLHHAFLEFPHS